MPQVWGVWGVWGGWEVWEVGGIIVAVSFCAINCASRPNFLVLKAEKLALLAFLKCQNF